jgi:hypothetical protein
VPQIFNLESGKDVDVGDGISTDELLDIRKIMLRAIPELNGMESSYSALDFLQSCCDNFVV